MRSNVHHKGAGAGTLDLHDPLAQAPLGKRENTMMAVRIVAAAAEQRI